MINSTDLKCFLTLSRTLSFTKAADILYMSQQAISQKILRFEKELGFPLFVRTRNYVKLTEEGKRCFDFFDVFYDQGQELLDKCRESYNDKIKELRVGYQNMLKWGNVLELVHEELSSEYKNTKLYEELFDSKILARHLESGQLDMIVIYGRFIPKGFEGEKFVLKELPLLLMVSSKLAEEKKAQDFRVFSKLPFIEDVFGNESREDTLSRAKKTALKCGLKPSEYIIVPNRDSANMAAEAGRGIIISTKMGAAGDSTRLKAFSLPLNEELVCLWKKGEENVMVHEYRKCLEKVMSRS